MTAALGLPLVGTRSARADACQDLLVQAEKLIARGEKAKDPVLLRQAIQVLDRAEQVCPEEAQAPFMAGLTYVLLGEKDAAVGAGMRMLGLLRQASLQQNRPPGEADLDPRVLYLAGLIRLHLDQDPVGAERQLSLVRQRTPMFMPRAVESALFSAVLLVGSRQMRKGDYEPSARSFRRAILLAGDDVARRDAARRNLAQVYRAAHEFPKSEEILVELAGEYPRDPVVQFALAGVFADQLKFDEAIRTWRIVLRLLDEKAPVDPRDLEQLQESRLRYGISLILGANSPEMKAAGLAEMLAYAKAHPDDGRGWFQLGRVSHEDLDDQAHAAEYLEKALVIDPWCERTLRLLVTIYTVHLPNPERAAKLSNCLEKNADRRKAEIELRKKVRSDGTDGCS